MMRSMQNMVPIKFLEDQIMGSYELICQYEAIRRDANDPKEKIQCKRQIKEQWELIEEYSEQYLEICNSLNHCIPSNIRQLIAYFPRLLATEFRSAYTKLKNVNADNSDALDEVINIIRGFGNYHEQLSEWKDLHNYSQELVTSLIPLKAEIESLLDTPPECLNKSSILRMWSHCRIQISRLESFAQDIKYIDVPYVRMSGKSTGPSWLLSTIVLKNELDICMKENDILTIYDSLVELWDVTFDSLFLADKKLRDNVSELYSLSSTLLRSIA